MPLHIQRMGPERAFLLLLQQVARLGRYQWYLYLGNSSIFNYHHLIARQLLGSPTLLALFTSNLHLMMRFSEILPCQGQPHNLSAVPIAKHFLLLYNGSDFKCSLSNFRGLYHSTIVGSNLLRSFTSNRRYISNYFNDLCDFFYFMLF